jgi:glyoxylase-like metal-dependent hydrolase (beta-lactamase superfamily II)
VVISNWGDDERRLNNIVSVLPGPGNGVYPSGNTLLVRGTSESVLIDPSVTIVARGAPIPVDAIINSHSHEDHVAGNGVFPLATVHVHVADLPGVQSLQGLMDVYGLPLDHPFAQTVVDEFHYTSRPDARGFTDGHIFDLGGGTTVEAVHLPGHTRGHSGFRIDRDVFFLSDIDLTGFGPYYGDVWSDLDDFEASLVKVRDVDAAWYVTFHQKGVIEGRAEFLRLLDAFHAVIDRRHRLMLEFLAEPHAIDDMVVHRFIYRPHVDHSFVNVVERRSAELHVQRMLTRDEVVEVEPGLLQAIR